MNRLVNWILIIINKLFNKSDSPILIIKIDDPVTETEKIISKPKETLEMGNKPTEDVIEYPKFKQPTTNQLIAKYGKPNETGQGYLTVIQSPYPMRLAWDLNIKVTRVSCHKYIANDLQNVFFDLLEHYGLEKIKELGIDLYGGCFNYRRMRGGTSWSTHAFAIAIDLDPARNRLKETSKTARFARPDYKPMIDIFYKHGFISLGVEKNYDWMHFQKR